MRIIVFSLGILILGLANSGGPGITQRRDRTGSPIGLNSNCSSCHFGGNFDGTISLSVLKDSVVVQEYQPGEEYLVKISFSHNGGGQQYGFQMVALEEDGLINAGTFGDLPEFIRNISLYNDQFDYVEHTRPLNDSVWYIPWKAPEESLENISFYLSGIVTNDDSNSSGDEVVWLRTPHSLKSTGLVNRKDGRLPKPSAIKIRCNPVHQEIELVSSLDLSRESVRYQITNWMGKVVKSGSLIGENISVYDLPKGGYILTIYNKKTLFGQIFLKQ